MRVFPVWSFNQRYVLSLDVTMSQVAVVYLENNPAGIKILASEVKRFSAVEDAGPDAVADFLKNFLQQNKVKTDRVYVSLFMADAVFSQTLILPDLPAAEIAPAATWQLKEALPFPQANILSGWQVVRTFKDDEGVRRKEVLFAALDKDVAQQYLMVLRSCRLNPCVLTSGFLNYGYCVDPAQLKSDTFAVLDIDDVELLLGVYKGSQLIFSRRLPVSWDKLTKALTEILVSEKGTTQLTYEEAAQVKNTVGIPLDEEVSGQGHTSTSHILSLMRPLLEALAREIKFSLSYFSSHFDMDAPASILLTGTGANLKNLDRYLSQELKIPVSFLKRHSEIIPDGADGQGLSQEVWNQLSRAVSAFVSRGKAINFLSEELKRQQEFERQKAFLRTSAVIFAVLLSFDSFLLHWQDGLLRRKMVSLQGESQVVAALVGLKEKVGLKENLADKIRQRTVPMEDILKHVSALIPAELELGEMSWDRSSGRVSLKGVARADLGVDTPVLTDFVEDLERLAVFSDATLVSSRKDGTAQEFEIQCLLRKNK